LKPPPFRYVAAKTVGEAVSRLAQDAAEAKILAGGQSLVPLLNFRLSHPQVLVDINRLSELDYVDRTRDVLRIGALTRHRTIETSPLVREHAPILSDAAAQIGHLAIRNRGTLGGSLAHADPAAELPLIAVLLDATVETTGSGGARRIPAATFFNGPLTTTLRGDEIITAMEISVLANGSGYAFREFTRRSGDFAIVAVGAVVSLQRGRCVGARIALGGAAGTPIRASAAETVLRDQAPSPDVIAAATRAARERAAPWGDLHASADFRSHLVEVLCRRTLESAFERAGHGP
jgi:carbon-monoxide dehydrogenase medium subunit